MVEGVNGDALFFRGPEFCFLEGKLGVVSRVDEAGAGAAESNCRPGRVERRVSASDNKDISADAVAFSELDFLKEIDGVEAGRFAVGAGDARADRLVGAGCDQDGLAALLAQAVDSDIPAYGDARSKLHTGVKDELYLAVHDLRRQPEVWYGQTQHPAGSGGGLEDRYRIAQQPEIARRGQARRAGSDDGHLFFPGRLGGGRRGLPPLSIVVGEEPLERPDGHRFVRLAKRAVRLARPAAEPSADTGEGIVPADHLQRFVEPARGGQRVVARHIHTDRADSLAGRRAQTLADHARTVLVLDVRVVFVAEVADRGKHGVGRRLAQSAEGRVFDDPPETFQFLDISFLSFALADARDDLEHPLGADAARRTLAAGFILHELEKEPRHVHHAGIFVHHDQAARAHDGAQFGDRLVVQGDVQVFGGDASARWPSDLRGLEVLAVRHASPQLMDHCLQRGPHRHFNQAGVVHGTRQGEDLGALAFPRAEGGEPLRAFEDNRRDVGVGFYVVQEAGHVPEALLSGEGRPGPGFAAVSFDGAHQGGFLAADKGAGAHADFKIEVEIGAEDLVAQQAERLRLIQSGAQPLHGQRILRPHIDVALRGADGVAGDRHRLDDAVRIALQDASVHECAGIAFIGVAEHVLPWALGLPAELPFESGWEPGPAAPAEARPLDDVNHFFRF